LQSLLLAVRLLPSAAQDTLCWFSNNDDTNRNTFLTTLNAARNNTALGYIPIANGRGYLPTTSNMNLLEYDCFLEAKAYQQVQGCKETETDDSVYFILGATQSGKCDILAEIASVVNQSFYESGLQIDTNPPRFWKAEQAKFAKIANADAGLVGCFQKYCGNDLHISCYFDKGSSIAQGNVYNKVTGTNVRQASRMSRMTYSCTLEQNAYDWARQCINKKSPGSDRYENIYAHTDTSLARREVARLAMERWWRQITNNGLPANHIFVDKKGTNMLSKIIYDEGRRWASLQHAVLLARSGMQPLRRKALFGGTLRLGLIHDGM
uniref:SCP domain-containing protein n=1 Tax=Nippostrongylus brasiliensis TaxID=27835 RepID=A0A0N4Y4L9_NIPBR